MYLDYNLSKFFCLQIHEFRDFKLEKRNTNIYFENFAEFVTEDRQSVRENQVINIVK